jgi:3-dehydroquinate synthase
VLAPAEAASILNVIEKYGPIPPLDGVAAPNIVGRLRSDKKTVQGKIHFVLPARIGEVRIVTDIDPGLALDCIEAALA